MPDIALRLALETLAQEEAIDADNRRLRQQVEDQRQQLETQTRDLCRLRAIIADQDAEIQRLRTQENR